MGAENVCPNCHKYLTARERVTHVCKDKITRVLYGFGQVNAVVRKRTRCPACMLLFIRKGQRKYCPFCNALLF